MSKKELKQKIAESFANKHIKHKSQYIRDLIEKEVSEELKIEKTETLADIRRKIDEIDYRQINGYKTFNKNTEALININKNINTLKAISYLVIGYYIGSFIVGVFA